MSNPNNYRQQADEAAARVQWCEKKLLFERKRHKALKELATSQDWLDGKVSPIPAAESTRALAGVEPAPRVRLKSQRSQT